MSRLQKKQKQVSPTATTLTVFYHRVTGATPKGAMPNFHRDPPNVFDIDLHTSKLNEIGEVRTAATMLNYYVRAFESAMQLYEHIATVSSVAHHAFESDSSDKQADSTLEIVDGWVAIAGRDGALTLFNFAKALEGLTSIAAKVPKFVAEGRVNKLGLARKKLLEWFPNIPAVRNSVAHSGEKFESAEKNLEHTFIGPWSNSQMSVEAATGATVGSILVDNLNQRVYSNTWDGQIVSYRLEEQSVRNLAEVRDLVFDALT